MAQQTDSKTILTLLLKAGQMFLESGAETYRAEDAALYMFNALHNGEISIFAVPTMVIIEITTEDGQVVSACKRIRRRAIHLGKIEQLNNIVRQVSCGNLNVPSALAALEELDHRPAESTLTGLFAVAAVASAFTLLLGGGILELLFGFCCCFLAQLVGLFFRSVSMYQFFNSILGGFVPTLIMLIVGRLLPNVSQEVVIISSMLPLFPGVAMVNAIRDAINGDLISGVSRAAEAMMIAVGLGIGGSLIFLLGVM